MMEYPENLQCVLGVRYCMLCHLEPDHYGFDLPQLLWSNEPFDDEVIEREVLARGWRTATVERKGPGTGLQVRVGGPPPTGDRWIGRMRDHNHSGLVVAGRMDVGRWPRDSPYLILRHAQDHSWMARTAGPMLYDKYDNPRPGKVGLTREQAVLLARAEGHELPTDAEVAAAVAAERDVSRAYSERQERFYAAREARFAPDIARLRAEAARLTELPPTPQREDDEKRREQAVAAIPALPVRPGESFPLVRFLIGRADERTPRRPGPFYRMSCNRLSLTLDDGVTLELTLEVATRRGSYLERAVTPFVPAETGILRDPAYPELQAPTSRLQLSARAFPASPMHLTPRGTLNPATRPDRWARIGLVLTFPGGIEYVAVPITDSASPWWYSAYRYDAATERTVGSEVHLFVPEDINLLKGVRARLVPAPRERR